MAVWPWLEHRGPPSLGGQWCSDSQPATCHWVCCQPGFPSDPVWPGRQPRPGSRPAGQELQALAVSRLLTGEHCVSPAHPCPRRFPPHGDCQAQPATYPVASARADWQCGPVSGSHKASGGEDPWLASLLAHRGKWISRARSRPPAGSFTSLPPDNP